MRAHYLQHVPFEGLGSIENWLQAAGYEITCTRFYESTTLPRIEEIDLLIVMGGPMSVNDEQEHPWLANEKTFIKEAIESDKATLGICLGAQLIVDTMGGKVFANTEKEIGWFPVRATASKPAAFKFPEKTEVFHWHGETFSLPSQAFAIAESDACKNQAFQISSHVIGLQFHLEVTPDSVQEIVSNCRYELVTGKYIQREADILSTAPARYHSVNALMNDILDFLTHKA